MVTWRPFQWPGAIEPPYNTRPGTLTRASAMTAAGIVLSQPTRATTPSRLLPRTTSSIESAITSRLTREARMPSVPIAMPSEIETVLTSSGVPPAARMPSLTDAASSRRCRLQGPISIHVLAIPINGLRRSASEKPAALNIARAPARCGPVVRGFELNVTSASNLRQRHAALRLVLALLVLVRHRARLVTLEEDHLRDAFVRVDFGRQRRRVRDLDRDVALPLGLE